MGLCRSGVVKAQYFRGEYANCAIDDTMSVNEESMLAFLTNGEC